MEEHISSKSEKDNKINKQLIKKYKSFEPDIKIKSQKKNLKPLDIKVAKL